MSATAAQAGARTRVPKGKHIRAQGRWVSTLMLVTLSALALVMLFPFYFMVVQATRPLDQLMHYTPPLTPGAAMLDNLAKLLKAVPLFRSLLNSVIIATAHTVLVLFFCSLAGFAFAVYDAPGRGKLFAFMMATMMIPGLVGIIPWFFIMRWFHWVNNPLALIIPGVANPFGIFWIRQYVSASLHPELLDSARMDGCPEPRIYAEIALPIMRPALGALGIYTFMGSWNSFLQPLIILNDKNRFTLPLALAQLTSFFQMPDYAVMMLGAAIGMIPVLVVFLLGSKQFIAGLTVGAIKG
jgi:multiple sugar transport system permease protein